MSLIEAFGKERQADFIVYSQHDLQSEFPVSQDYTMKPCLKKKKNQKKKKTQNKNQKTKQKASMFFKSQTIISLYVLIDMLVYSIIFRLLSCLLKIVNLILHHE